MRALFASFAALLCVAPLSLPAHAASKCLHIDDVTTWSVPHLLVNNEWNESVTVTLYPIEFSPSWATAKTWTVAAKKEQKVDLVGMGGRYDRISVSGNGLFDQVVLLPAYEAKACENKYWAIRVKVYGGPKTINGIVHYVEGGYRFK